MRAVIIVNPKSGLSTGPAGVHASRRDRAAAWAKRTGIAVEVIETASRGHGAELASSFTTAGVDRVVVWGGDGTVNEAAGPLIGTGTALGIIPGGSGDGLVRSMKLPRDPETALRLALQGKPRPIDVGWLGTRHFLNIAGVGFDAEVARRFNLRKVRGTRGYITEGLKVVWSYGCESCEIIVDGRKFAGAHFMAAFANGREYGSGLVIAPDADPSDGWFDMVIVSGGGPLRQLWRSRRLGYRRTSPAEGITRDRVKAALIIINGERLCCHVDGETFDASGELEVRMKPGSLQIVSES